MADTKNIDELVRRRQEHQASLRQVADEIKRSGRQAAIVFVDLSDSAASKEGTDPDVWLAYVFDFIRAVEQLARQFGGTVVKRIGDELLLTFDSAVRCDDFIEALYKSETLASYQFKVAADFGEVFFFQFGDHLEDDPYGTPVDRCARIAKLATAGTIICSGAYEGEVRARDLYMNAGVFKLAGMSQPETVFVRRRHGVDDLELYLKPLLDSLNDRDIRRPHYHFVSRKFAVADFEVGKSSSGRPFLIRELLNVPKLPLSQRQFQELLDGLEYKEEKQDYVGYLVEWEAVYVHSEIIGDMLAAFMRGGPGLGSGSVVLRLPPMYFDIARSFKKEEVVRFRGLIVGIDQSVTLDFVDLALPDTAEPAEHGRMKKWRLW